MDINWIGPINQLGYGVASYNIVRSLNRLGHNIALFPIGKPSWTSDAESIEVLNKCSRLAIEQFHRDAPSVRMWHQFEMDLFPGKGLRIGWPIFELDTFTNIEKHHLSSLDVILVCSEWAKNIVVKNGITVPTFVVPLGVDPDVFFYDESGKESRQYWNASSTIFMNVGKWEKRKGHEEICAAFNAAFSPSDDVELWMLNDNLFIGHENFEWRKKYAHSAMGNKVQFFDRIDSHGELRKLYAQIDCFVTASHAEGFNLEPLEAMACGAHVIGTNYSGHTEYMNSENTWLIEPNGMEVANDGKWFQGQGNWCSYSLDELVELMRGVHKRKQDGNLTVNKPGIETAKRFTWENSARKLVQTIENVRVSI